MCVPLISMCCLRGRTCVSLCRWGIGVVWVQPVAIRSAVFCVTCSLFMCVVAVSGCHDGWAYVSKGLMNCLYTRVVLSLTLFNLYMHDIPLPTHPEVHISYAEAITIFSKHPNPETAASHLQEHIYIMEQWLYTNRLSVSLIKSAAP